MTAEHKPEIVALVAVLVPVALVVAALAGPIILVGIVRKQARRAWRLRC